MVVDSVGGETLFERYDPHASPSLEIAARADYSPDGTRLVQLLKNDTIQLLDASTGESTTNPFSLWWMEGHLAERSRFLPTVKCWPQAVPVSPGFGASWTGMSYVSPLFIWPIQQEWVASVSARMGSIC